MAPQMQLSVSGDNARTMLADTSEHKFTMSADAAPLAVEPQKFTMSADAATFAMPRVCCAAGGWPSWPQGCTADAAALSQYLSHSTLTPSGSCEMMADDVCEVESSPLWSPCSSSDGADHAPARSKVSTSDGMPKEAVCGQPHMTGNADVAIIGPPLSVADSRLQPSRSSSGSENQQGTPCKSISHPQVSDALPSGPCRTYRFRPQASEGGAISRAHELRREVQSLLNKICPENLGVIAKKIGKIPVGDAAELEHVVSLIFKKALAEPHYCETYADLVFRLREAFPEFPSPDGGKAFTVKTALLNICQQEFEALPTSFTPTEQEVAGMDREELEFRRLKIKKRVLANIKFIGHLFLRKLVAPSVIGAIITELTLCHDATRTPEEHIVECAVELLISIGHTLESMPVGAEVLRQVCGRLLDLKSQRQTPRGPGLYSKRVQFAIQNLLEVRKAGWARKVFGGIAKTKEDIWREQQQEEATEIAAVGQQVIAGQRPAYLMAASSEFDASARD